MQVLFDDGERQLLRIPDTDVRVCDADGVPLDDRDAEPATGRRRVAGSV